MPLPDQTPKLPKLPFLIGDVALLATAWLIANDSQQPLPVESILAIVGCVAVAAIIGVIPFLSDYARRQDEALDERQRSLESIARTVADSAERIGIATRGLQEKTEQLESAAEKIAKAIAEGTKVEAAAERRTAGKERKRAVSAEAEEESPWAKEESAKAEEPVVPPAESQILTNSATSKELVEAPAPVAETSAPAAEPIVPAPPAPKPPRKPRAPKPKPEPVEDKEAEAIPGAEAGAAPRADESVFSLEAAEAEPAEGAAVDAIASDGATRLLVTAYIGIGNRLFIRGDGPGLSWDKGVPLQFVSIGKWRWEAENASAPITLKLYKNDETECVALGQLELQPGHQQEVSARF